MTDQNIDLSIDQMVDQMVDQVTDQMFDQFASRLGILLGNECKHIFHSPEFVEWCAVHDNNDVTEVVVRASIAIIQKVMKHF